MTTTTDAPFQAPRRAVRLTLVMDADSRHDLASLLLSMAEQIERGQITTGVSGGYSSGSIYELTEDPTITHDDYFAQLQAYLATQAAGEHSKTRGGKGEAATEAAAKKETNDA